MAEKTPRYLVETGKHTLVYGFGTVATKLVGFVLLPLYSGAIPPWEFGVYGLLEVVSQVLTRVVSLGLPSAMFKYLSLYQCPEKQRKVVGTAFAGILVASCVVLPVAYGAELDILRASGSRFEGSQLFAVALPWILACQLLDVGFSSLLGVPLNILRFKGKSVSFAVLSLIRFTLVLAMNVILVGHYRLGIFGIFASQAVISFAILLFSSIYLGVGPAIRSEVHLLRGMLTYGLPLLPLTLSTLLMNLGNRYVIAWLASLEDVAKYTFVQKIGGSLNMILFQPFSLGYFPMLWRVARKPELDRFQVRSLTYFVLVGCWFSVVFFLFSREITVILLRNPLYHAVHLAVPLIAVSYVLYGAGYVGQAPFHLAGKTYWIALLLASGCVVNLCLSLALVPQYGAIGAAIAMVLSYLFVLAATLQVAKKFRNFPYEWERIGIALVAAVGTCAVGLASVSLAKSATVSLVVRAFFGFAYPGLLWLLGVPSEDEKRNLSAMLRSLTSHVCVKGKRNV